MNFKTYILGLAVFFLCTLQAQENEGMVKPRPKVGLVLSGGGAKGLAHIGVIKVLDSLNVPIDYVAGSSMGAIIGSLYASGYTGNQLDSIFHDVDFDELINDDLPRVVKDFNERENDEKYAFKLPFSHLKIKLPSALSRGHNTYNLLTKLTLHVSHIKDFDKLPIPFFCMATNIETGKQKVLDRGNLTQAVMASSALPSLYQPVIINDEVLLDGGVVNNYPVDELRAKGVDLIIGVDVQDGLANRDELTSAPSVLIQINNFRTINDMILKSKRTDVYIKPNIKDFSVISFSDGEGIIESGKQGALSKLHVLRELSRHSKNEKDPVQIKPVDSIIINNIEIKGIKNYTRSYVIGKLKINREEKISYQNFMEGLNNLVATNNFDYVDYNLEKTKYDEGHDLILNVKEYDINTFLKLGIHYDKLYKSAALVNLTKKRLLLKNDIASLDLIFGDNVRYNFHYLIDKGFYWSFGLTSRFNQFRKDINPSLLLEEEEIGANLNSLDVELQDQTNQFYVRTFLTRDFALSLGAEHKRLNIVSETISTEFEDAFTFENTDYFSAYGNIKLDIYDDKYFPSKGFYFDGDLHMYLFASRFNSDFEPFSIAKATMGYAFSLTDKWSFNFQTSGGFKIDNRSTTTLDFALGGYGNNLINNFIPFLGYDFISLTGNSYVKAYASSDFEIFKKHHVTVEGNWANMDNDIFASGEWFSLPDYRGYALGYAIETFIGPIQAKYSYSPEQKESVWFFNLGFWF